MTQSTSNAVATKSPLDAAQKIVAELQGVDPKDQSLALQFAMQTLRLDIPSTTAAAQPLAVTPPNQQQPATAGVTGQTTDIKSFTAAKSPKSDQQFTAVVAYFYQFEAQPDQRKDSIDAATMKDAARLAGRPQVGSWLTTLNNATRSGFLDRADRGAFKLNSVGENLVAITLPGNGTSGTGNGSGTGKKVAKKKATTRKIPKKNG